MIWPVQFTLDVLVEHKQSAGTNPQSTKIQKKKK